MGYEHSPGPFTKVGAFDPPEDILGDDEPDQDVEMGGADGTGGDVVESEPDSLIVAVDFGTTFSSVAYARVTKDTPREFITVRDVKCISNFPDDRLASAGDSIYGPRKPRQDVPTELWYQSNQKTNEVDEEFDEEDENDGSTASESSSQPEQDSDSENDGGMDLEPKVATHELRGSSYMFWGFGVQKELRKIDTVKDGAGRLARFKLMLAPKKKETDPVREELAPILRKLKRAKIIKRDTDIITDYLEQLLKHTKSELERLGIYRDGTPVEFVLCVPAVWPCKAVLDMQKSMTGAVERSGLGSLLDGSLENLFIVSEPEAAAMCVLAEDQCDVQPGEYVLILDAGGGTIDATTYEVANPFPLRFQSELVRPGNKLCGASYINERYKALLKKRLKREKNNLAKVGRTMEGIIDNLVMQFENNEKRFTDTTSAAFQPDDIPIVGLKHSKEKMFKQNLLIVSKKEMTKVFALSLEGAAELLRDQLNLAQGKGYAVKKVILVGGFGESPALKSCLKKVVAEEKNIRQHEIDFLIPDASSTAIARGAVLRALNKEDGPERVTGCSYGFLRSEFYRPDIVPAHLGVRPHWDKVDGEKYVDKTIDWLIKAGERLPHRKEYRSRVRHTIPVNRKKLECKEQLWMCDEPRESHYRCGHPMNEGSILAGEIVADMTSLRDQQRIPKLPTAPLPNARRGAKQEYHWAVEFDLVMIIDGRNLRYEARYPPLPEPDDSDVEEQQVDPSSQKVYAAGQVCIAAAFKPGTL